MEIHCAEMLKLTLEHVKIKWHALLKEAHTEMQALGALELNWDECVCQSEKFKHVSLPLECI